MKDPETFTFSHCGTDQPLNEWDNLHFIKGDNPLCRLDLWIVLMDALLHIINGGEA